MEARLIAGLPFFAREITAETCVNAVRRVDEGYHGREKEDPTMNFERMFRTQCLLVSLFVVCVLPRCAAGREWSGSYVRDRHGVPGRWDACAGNDDHHVAGVHDGRWKRGSSGIDDGEPGCEGSAAHWHSRRTQGSARGHVLQSGDERHHRHHGDRILGSAGGGDDKPGGDPHADDAAKCRGAGGNACLCRSSGSAQQQAMKRLPA